MSATVGIVIAAMEEYYKKYLIVCEYLKLDPTVKHNLVPMVKRYDALILNEDVETDRERKRLKKDLKWFLTNYETMVDDSWRGYGFIKKTKRLIEKGQLVIHEGTVADSLETFDLTRKNFDFYAQKQQKAGLIALGIFFGTILIGGIVTALILL